MKNRAAPCLMLMLISGGIVVGFATFPGPQKNIGMLLGWVMGTLFAAMIPSKASYAVNKESFLAVSFVSIVIATVALSYLIAMNGVDGSPVGGLMVVVSTLTIALSVSFGAYYLIARARSE